MRRLVIPYLNTQLLTRQSAIKYVMHLSHSLIITSRPTVGLLSAWQPTVRRFWQFITNCYPSTLLMAQRKF